MCDSKHPPILRNKNYKRPSVFTPENLLREAKRQKNIANHKVPRICLLDPDGDIVQNLRAKKMASINPYWACYHTRMYVFRTLSVPGNTGSRNGSRSFICFFPCKK